MSITRSPRLFDRRVALGIAFVVLIGLTVVGTIASYRGTFRDTVSVTMHADRAGQTLAAGAVVKLRGVEVGTVDSVRTTSDGVRIELGVERDQIGRIPSDVTAQIVPPTAFGAKYVQLTDPATGTKARMSDGDVISADRVTVEVDQAFESLTRVLDVAQPAAVSGALTALADTVQDRGDRIGDLVERSNAYLAGLNPSLEALTDDLKRADEVAATYAAVRPDLITTLTSLATTGDTLTSQQDNLRKLSLGLRAFSREADTLLTDSGPLLEQSLATFAPVSGVLAKYAPELPCTILGLAAANKLAEAAVGGTHPGVTTITRVVPGRDPYSYPGELPVVDDLRGPGCYGLPFVSPAEAKVPATGFKSGANPYNGVQPGPAERTTTTLLNLLVGGGNLL